MSVHNGERDILRAANSILGQAGVSLELIVVDDGSSDGTPGILQRLAQSDARVRVHAQANQGLTRALIFGCAQARGRYIARQDSDDVSLPGRLRRQLDLLESDPGLAFVSCWSEVEGPGGETVMTHQRPEDSCEATDWLMRRRIGPPGHGSVMFRRDVYEHAGGYRALFYYAQDSDLWVRLALHGRLAYVPAVLYRYRIDPASISSRCTHIRADYERLVNRLHVARHAGEDEAAIIAATVLPDPKPGANGASSPGDTLYFIGRNLLARRDARALGYLWRAVRAQPSHWRAFVLLLPALALSWRPFRRSTA